MVAKWVYMRMSGTASVRVFDAARSRSEEREFARVGARSTQLRNHMSSHASTKAAGSDHGCFPSLHLPPVDETARKERKTTIGARAKR